MKVREKNRGGLHWVDPKGEVKEQEVTGGPEHKRSGTISDCMTRIPVIVESEWILQQSWESM